MNTDAIIEFDKLKELWAMSAVTEAGKQQILNTTFYFKEGELRKNLKDTSDARKFLETCGNIPLSSIEEVKEVIKLATKEGCLSPYQLERVQGSLVAIRRLRDYLNRGKLYENSLAYYALDLEPLDDLWEEITRQIRGEEVDDYATKELLQIRREMEKLKEGMKQKADQVMRGNKECMADQFSTLRNGHLCIPVKKEYKWKISGNSIDKSATGNTIFVEPLGVSHMYEELSLLKIQEENEVYKILYTLTAMVAAEETAMLENIRVMERLDYIFSKGKLSLDLHGVEPSINLERRIRLTHARHPLMEVQQYIPLEFQVGNGIHGIIITGPNTGGKTVAIKTVALNCLMAQCGLHVTCEEADICMNSSFLCDIGDGQNIKENLSTFSAHIKNVLEIMNQVDQDSLVIMDELGSGTDPTEGMGLAISILEELRKSGCLFLVTTHYPEVKVYGEGKSDLKNARMEFDKETLRPTYKMIPGESGESCAFYIAEKLGMSNTMLRRAVEAAYGPEAVENYHFIENKEEKRTKKPTKVKAQKQNSNKASQVLVEKYRMGDSVRVFPDKKIGIVCKPINEKGVLQVQLPNKKIWINHKRVKLEVAASELYPEDYDFSILFESVEQRKIRHDMSRKYTKESIQYEE